MLSLAWPKGTVIFQAAWRRKHKEEEEETVLVLSSQVHPAFCFAILFLFWHQLVLDRVLYSHTVGIFLNAYLPEIMRLTPAFSLLEKLKEQRLPFVFLQ